MAEPIRGQELELGADPVAPTLVEQGGEKGVADAGPHLLQHHRVRPANRAVTFASRRRPGEQGSGSLCFCSTRRWVRWHAGPTEHTFGA